MEFTKKFWIGSGLQNFHIDAALVSAHIAVIAVEKYRKGCDQNRRQKVINRGALLLGGGGLTFVQGGGLTFKFNKNSIDL